MGFHQILLLDVLKQLLHQLDTLPLPPRPIIAVGRFDVTAALPHATIAAGRAFTPLAPRGKVAISLG